MKELWQVHVYTLEDDVHVYFTNKRAAEAYEKKVNAAQTVNPATGAITTSATAYPVRMYSSAKEAEEREGLLQ